MTTRMIHPEHGATHAYDNSEIERLKGFGWAVEVPPAPLLQEPEEGGEPEQSEVPQKDQPAKRGGRKTKAQ